MKWIIVEKSRNFQETHEGVRWIARPFVDDDNEQQMIDICYDPDEDKGYRITEQIGRG
jgi:hypothetical protein